MRKIMRYILQLTVSMMLGILILGIQFYVTSSKEKLIGHLAEIDSFGIVDTHTSETWHHQLIRAIDDDAASVSFFLYSNQENALFTFLDEDDQEIESIHGSLLIDDYQQVILDVDHFTTVRMTVHIENSLVDTVTFIYMDHYKDAKLLDVYPNQSNLLLLYEEISTNITIFEYIKTQFLWLAVIIVSLTAFFNIVHIIYKNINIKSIPVSERMSIHLENIGKFFSKFKWLLKQLTYNLFGGLFIYVISTLLLVIFFGDDEAEGLEPLQEAVYFHEVSNGFDITVNIGASDSTWNDSDYGPNYIYYDVVFNSKPSGYYVASLSTENGYQGRALSDQGLLFSGYEDPEYTTINIYDAEDFESSETFEIVIRNAATGLIVFESDTYILYKQYDDVSDVFGIVIEPEPWQFSLYMFLFHVVITTSLIRYVYYRGTDKRLARQAKRKALQDTQAYWDKQ
jgi:hypothetical protein